MQTHVVFVSLATINHHPHHQRRHRYYIPTTNRLSDYHRDYAYAKSTKRARATYTKNKKKKIDRIMSRQSTNSIRANTGLVFSLFLFSSSRTEPSYVIIKGHRKQPFQVRQIRACRFPSLQKKGTVSL